MTPQTMTEWRLRERVEYLEEDNRQLRDRIASLIGRNWEEAARKRFGLTKRQAKLFTCLVSRGGASHDHLLDAVYEPAERRKLIDEMQSVRTLTKYVRRAVAKHGVRIKSVYAFGWQLDDADRIRARQMLEGGH